MIFKLSFRKPDGLHGPSFLEKTLNVITHSFRQPEMKNIVALLLFFGAKDSIA